MCSTATRILAVALAAIVLAATTATCSVTYDRKAIVINGQRRILFSGSIHYPRSVPEMWPGLIQKAKDGGLDVIQTYVFWNGHEPSPGNYYFQDRYDLVQFVKLVKQAGLYVHLRIGPYICGEWNFGGFPVWLKYVPGIQFRTDNGPFKAYMQQFTTKIVSMMKAEGLFQSQGGPIIMSQIENEYGPLEYYDGPGSTSYTYWAAKMAVGLNTGVPWVMCKQDDAPDPVINTCNGFYCDSFSPNKPYKPTMWTENWTGWFTAFGGAVPHRPVEDIAFATAKFIQKGGSFVNYYMYHGGTNFGRTAGGPFIATSYDYDAPIDEYGLIRQRKWGHLRDLHKAIKMCEPSLVGADPTVSSLGGGGSAQAHVFRTKTTCAAFLENYNTGSPATVIFNGLTYNLPPWSISILPDCKTVVFNTAKVAYPDSEAAMVPVGGFAFQSYKDWDSVDDRSFTANGLLEQVNVTRDTSDYLWYSTFVNVAQAQSSPLVVMSAGHTLHVFVNGKYVGTSYGGYNSPKITYSGTVSLWAGSNKISILSVAVGLPNVGNHYETWNTGVLGPVTLGGKDISHQQWTYRVGLKGESMSLHSVSGSSSVEWGAAVPKQNLVWYKAFFNAPAGNDPVALDMGSMGKGEIWVNGHSVGRYWPAYKASGNCGGCSYAGTFTEKKCGKNCGEASQRWYHVPRSWLNPTGNLLVVFEEWGGDPKGISLVKRSA